MVNPIYVPAHKRLGRELKKVRAGLKDAQRPTGTQKNQTLRKLQEALDTLASVVQGLADTVAELLARSAFSRSPANIEITASTPGLYPIATRSMSFPSPGGGGRVATLAISAEFVRVSTSGDITIWMEILQDGVSTWRRTSAFYVGDALSAPPAWGNPAINEPMQLEVETAADAEMQIRLYAHVFVAGAVTARMQNIRATLTYGARI